jgi:hypothetical protein
MNPAFLNMLSLANSQISRTPLQIVDNVSAIVRSSITMAGMVGILAAQHWLRIIPAVILNWPFGQLRQTRNVMRHVSD